MPLSWEDALETAAEPQRNDSGRASGALDAGYSGWIAPGHTFNALDLLRTPNYEPPRPRAPPPIFPTLVLLPAPAPESVPADTGTGGGTVVAAEEDQATDDGEEAFPESMPTYSGDGVLVPRPSVLDYPPDYPYGTIPPIEESELPAFDWGTMAGNVISSYVGARYASAPVSQLVAAQPNQYGIINQSTPAAPGVQQVMASGDCSTCPPNGPRFAKICLATGETTPLRRRRRRRLLTAGDLNDIAALKALVGGGAALNAAVVKAMR